MYRITDIDKNKHYIGSRTSNIHPSLDLGKKYFSSSSDKEFKKKQRKNPELFKYKVIRIFVSKVLAINFEIKLHEKYDVGVNELFYNRSKQTSTKFDTTGRVLSPEHVEKIREANTGERNYWYGKPKEEHPAFGRVVSEDTRRKMSERVSGELNPMFGKHGELNPMYGKTHTPKVRKKLSEIRTGVPLSEETKRKVSENSKMRGLRGWEVPSIKPHHVEIWSNAVKYYNWWIEENKGFTAMCSFFKEPPLGTHRTMVQYFKNGWIPTNDEKWIESFGDMAWLY